MSDDFTVLEGLTPEQVVRAIRYAESDEEARAYEAHYVEETDNGRHPGDPELFGDPELPVDPDLPRDEDDA